MSAWVDSQIPCEHQSSMGNDHSKHWLIHGERLNQISDTTSRSNQLVCACPCFEPYPIFVIPVTSTLCTTTVVLFNIWRHKLIFTLQNSLGYMPSYFLILQNTLQNNTIHTYYNNVPVGTHLFRCPFHHLNTLILLKIYT